MVARLTRDSDNYNYTYEVLTPSNMPWDYYSSESFESVPVLPTPVEVKRL